MLSSNDESPISPMKKLKILSEKQNVQTIAPRELLETVKEVEQIPEEKKTSKECEEPLMQESSGQYVIFPINNKDMWHMYKHFVDTFWNPNENMEELDKLNLSIDERQFLKFFASFFASPNSKDLVIDTYAEDFCKTIQVTEARFFYGHQLFVQDIHYEIFNKILDKISSGHEEKEKLFKIVEGFDAVIKKRNWINQWENADFGVKMAASACVHGIFFISLDLVYNWLKNKLRGTHDLIEVLEKMIADKELCRDFACLMLSHIKLKPNREAILQMINSSVKTEFDFILNGIKTDLIHSQSDDLIQLIDRKTTALKSMILGSLGEKAPNIGSLESADSENITVQKENQQKITFDEDF